jgi:hypothetical protein
MSTEGGYPSAHPAITIERPCTRAAGFGDPSWPPRTPRWVGGWAVTHEHGEQCGGGVPQKESHFLPPIHRFGHGDVEIRIDAKPGLDVDDYDPPKPPLPCLSPTGAGRERSGSRG